MSLMKRGEIWWSYLYIDGVRHQQSTNTTSKRQAETIEARFKAEANARRHQLVEYDPRLTVAAVVARFLSDGQAKNFHIWHLKALLPFFGDFEIR